MTDRVNILSEENSLLKQKLEASDLINNFIGMLSTAEDPNRALGDVIAEIGAYMKAERTFIFERCGDNFSNTFEWCAEGVPSIKDKLRNIDTEIFSIWYEKLEKGEPIIEDDMNSLSNTGKLIYRFAKQNNIYVVSLAPIIIGGKLTGLLGVNNAPKKTIELISNYISYLAAYIGIVIKNKQEHDRLIKVNEEIIDSKNMQEQLLDSVCCGVFSYTIPQLELFSVNDEAKRILECGDAEDLSEAFLNFYENMIHPDDSDCIIQGEKKLKKVGDEINHTYRVIGKGGIKYVKANVRLLKFSNGQKYLLNSILDITEQALLMNDLKREQKSCREALMKNCEYNFFFDLTEGLIYEDFVTAHEISIVKMLGLELPVSFDEMCRRYIEVGHLRFLEKEMEKNFTCKGLIEAYNKGVTNVITEYYNPIFDMYTRANGLISRDEDTGHLHIFVIADDVTESRKKEEAQQIALKKENEELNRITSELADLLGSGIFAYTLPDHRVLMMNQEARRMFDIPEQITVMKGNEVTSKVVEADREIVHNAVVKLKKPGDSVSYAFHNIMKDGSIATIRCTTKLLSFSNGQQYVLSSLNEITEQEALENRLEEERRQYRNALMLGSETIMTIDLTEGFADSEIITVDGRTIMKELELTLPAYYDDFARRFFNENRIETESDEIEILKSRKKMLSAFKKGVSIIEVDYFVKNIKQYIHCLIMLYKVDEHIKATFIFYDTSVRISEEKKRRVVIECLGKAYTAIYHVSFKDNVFTSLKQVDDTKAILPHNGSYTEYSNVYIDKIVDSEFAESMKDFLNIDSICSKLSGEDIIKTEFRKQNKDLVRVDIIAAERNKNGDIESVVIAGYMPEKEMKL